MVCRAPFSGAAGATECGATEIWGRVGVEKMRQMLEYVENPSLWERDGMLKALHRNLLLCHGGSCLCISRGKQLEQTTNKIRGDEKLCLSKVTQPFNSTQYKGDRPRTNKMKNNSEKEAVVCLELSCVCSSCPGGQLTCSFPKLLQSSSTWRGWHHLFLVPPNVWGKC